MSALVHSGPTDRAQCSQTDLPRKVGDDNNNTNNSNDSNNSNNSNDNNNCNNSNNTIKKKNAEKCCGIMSTADVRKPEKATARNWQSAVAAAEHNNGGSRDVPNDFNSGESLGSTVTAGNISPLTQNCAPLSPFARMAKEEGEQKRPAIGPRTNMENIERIGASISQSYLRIIVLLICVFGSLTIPSSGS
ncbi:unnamed protein product [Polarella glacialis]|uniref:Uncharacterized protein n=1 Tax=Polarella glacialis TaxID=89957 RepID=A0A813J7K8_POLGL|nr:unnamed protein product [Polarella glacialis]